MIQITKLSTFVIKTRIVAKCPLVCSAVGMKRSAGAKQEGISEQTAWSGWQRGISTHPLPSGKVLVATLPPPQAVCHRKVVVSARVSSREYRMRLDRQAERALASCAASGWQVVKESGADTADQRPHVLRLLADRDCWLTPAAVRAYRTTRIAAPTWAWPLSSPCSTRRSVQLVRGNDAKDGQEGQHDILQDCTTIIPVWTARLSGRRRASWKAIPGGAALEATR
jgi:predicted site-specific integrase-resolvase